MDNGYHGVFHGPNLPERIWSSAQFREPFLVPLVCWGVFALPLAVSFYSLFTTDFFLLNGVPRVDTCPISPSLQLLRVIVRTGKYGRIKHKALNAIMATYPLDTSLFSFVLFYLSIFPALWDDIKCHYQWQVASFILGYIHAEEDSPHGRGGVFPWAEIGRAHV